jgi:hypothetical protein
MGAYLRMTYHKHWGPRKYATGETAAYIWNISAVMYHRTRVSHWPPGVRGKFRPRSCAVPEGVPCRGMIRCQRNHDVYLAT